MVLRECKTVDFYFNGAKLFSSGSYDMSFDTTKTFSRIGPLTTDHIYLYSDADNSMYRMRFDGKKRVLFSQAKRISQMEAISENRIYHERIKHERIELFFDFKVNNHGLYVTYDKFVSHFDLMDKELTCTTAKLGTDEA